MISHTKSLSLLSLCLGLSLIIGAGAQAKPFSTKDEEVTITNIANTKGAVEKPYAEVRGWKIVTGSVKGKMLYCAAIKNVDQSLLRLGFDGLQWQVGVPHSLKSGDFTGMMELDGKTSGTSGISDGKWTFLWLNLGERDALMNGKLVTFDIGKASFDYNLKGSAAAALKVKECAERHVKLN